MRVVVVGLEFGAEFVPIYADHPGVTSVGVADLRADLAAEVARRFGIEHVYPSLDTALADPAVDAVHIVTGLTAHAGQVVQALTAGKHVDRAQARERSSRRGSGGLGPRGQHRRCPWRCPSATWPASWPPAARPGPRT
jgi:GFO/IDH/MocA oxidoreductase family protein